MNTRKNYTSPETYVESIEVEQGIALSGTYGTPGYAGDDLVIENKTDW